MQTIQANSDILSVVMNFIIASRYDLLMFGTGLMMYALLCKYRGNAKVAMGVHSELKTTTTTEPAKQKCTSSEHVQHVEVVPACAVIETAEHDTPSRDEHSLLEKFICSYISGNQFERACDVYEMNFVPSVDNDLNEQVHWKLMNAASQCGRVALADQLQKTLPPQDVRRVLRIQSWWRWAQSRRRQARVSEIGSVLSRLSRVFDDDLPVSDDEEEGSDGESTCFLGDGADLGNDSDIDDCWEESGSL
jgi:hypothetical protein